MGRIHTFRALLALACIALWNRLVSRYESLPEPTMTATNSAVIEHERNWYDYVRGFHAHHGNGPRRTNGDHPEHGSFWTGLACWYESNCLRGYTLGDDVYVCPDAPRIVRVHQAGHAPSFGAAFEPLCMERRPDGGLEDEPLLTLDVMLPGRFPHTLLRFRDPRGLDETYGEWIQDGRIARR